MAMRKPPSLHSVQSVCPGSGPSGPLLSLHGKVAVAQWSTALAAQTRSMEEPGQSANTAALTSWAACARNDTAGPPAGSCTSESFPDAQGPPWEALMSVWVLAMLLRVCWPVPKGSSLRVALIRGLCCTDRAIPDFSLVPGILDSPRIAQAVSMRQSGCSRAKIRCPV